MTRRLLDRLTRSHYCPICWQRFRWDTPLGLKLAAHWRWDHADTTDITQRYATPVRAIPGDPDDGTGRSA